MLLTCWRACVCVCVCVWQLMWGLRVWMLSCAITDARTVMPGRLSHDHALMLRTASRQVALSSVKGAEPRPGIGAPYVTAESLAMVDRLVHGVTMTIHKAVSADNVVSRHSIAANKGHALSAVPLAFQFAYTGECRAFVLDAARGGEHKGVEADEDAAPGSTGTPLDGCTLPPRTLSDVAAIVTATLTRVRSLRPAPRTDATATMVHHAQVASETAETTGPKRSWREKLAEARDAARTKSEDVQAEQLAAMRVVALVQWVFVNAVPAPAVPPVQDAWSTHSEERGVFSVTMQSRLLAELSEIAGWCVVQYVVVLVAARKVVTVCGIEQVLAGIGVCANVSMAGWNARHHNSLSSCHGRPCSASCAAGHGNTRGSVSAKLKPSHQRAAGREWLAAVYSPPQWWHLR